MICFVYLFENTVLPVIIYKSRIVVFSILQFESFECLLEVILVVLLLI